ASSSGQSRLYALNPRDGSTRWTADLPAGSVNAVPVVGDDMLYMQIGTATYALQASDGRQLKRLEGEFPVAVGNGVLYTLTLQNGFAGTNDLSAWRTSDWSRLWRVERDILPQALLADGVLYAGTSDNRVVALDLTTRRERWISPPDITAAVGSHVDQTPILAHGVLYVHYRDAHVVAFDPATGKQRWATQIGDESRVNGFVFAGGYAFTTGFLQSSIT